MKKTIIALAILLFPGAAFASAVTGFPDWIACTDVYSGDYAIYIIQGQGVVNNTGDVYYQNDLSQIEGFLSTPSVQQFDSSGNVLSGTCTEGYTDIAQYPQGDFGGATSTTSTSTSPYAPSEDEFLFVFGLFLFIGTIPFWNWLLSVTRGGYDL